MSPRADAPAGWRAMRAADLAAVEAVAAIVHPDYPEDAAVFVERLALFPDGCRVLEGAQGIAGYVVSHPWRAGMPPALDTLLGALPAEADSYYIHDLALLPAARGGGWGARAVADLAALAAGLGLAEMSLVAVGPSGGFWRARGFEAAALPAGKLASYGGAAAHMRRALA